MTIIKKNTTKKQEKKKKKQEHNTEKNTKLTPELNSHKVILGLELVSTECFTQVTQTKLHTLSNVFARTKK